ncbi:hypothetical protein B0H17DRAFT_1204626 [Mycena rosella]|uniref:Uncharacterized protein n=1 Tax=Mycena rosella TaxID=1033263 RepID=A0AAD7D9H7_MYCRO|nr:hypothetical protein B0H17DRAFT_1204626 [Mycena rosella]
MIAKLDIDAEPEAIMISGVPLVGIVVQNDTGHIRARGSAEPRDPQEAFVVPLWLGPAQAFPFLSLINPIREARCGISRLPWLPTGIAVSSSCLIHVVPGRGRWTSRNPALNYFLLAETNETDVCPPIRRSAGVGADEMYDHFCTAPIGTRTPTFPGTCSACPAPPHLARPRGARPIGQVMQPLHEPPVLRQ